MKKMKYYICAFLMAVLFTACEEVMDNKRDLGSLTPDEVWDSPDLTKRYMDNIISGSGIPDVPYGPVYEKSTYTEEHGTEQRFMHDQHTSNDDSPLGFWNYTTIRNINKFLANVDKVEKLTQADRESFTGQVKVMRAWNYFLSVRAYGGVPLILHEQMVDEDLHVPRSKTSVCINQIIQDLDDAIALGGFPMRWTTEADAGRISKAIAYALKARVLLTYASPQFTKQTPAGTKSKEERWNDAYKAFSEAKAALDAAGFGLFRGGADKSFDDAVQDYYDMFIEEMPNNPEMIWVRRKYRNGPTNNFWSNCSPPSHGGSPFNIPTLELIREFLNADGTSYTGLNALISAAAATGNTAPKVPSATSTVPYWQGREPRFYATIAYNGCVWPLKRNQAYTENEVPDQHQWFFVNATLPYDNSAPATSGSINGIACRKMVDINQDWQNDPSGVDLPVLRYAEIVLGLAECAAKTGKEAEAVALLKQIRQRAGIPPANNYGLGATPPTGDNLILTILKERLIEFAYEGIRFYDLLRWRLYTDELAGFKLNGTMLHTIGAEMNHFNPIEDRGSYQTVLYNFEDINVPGNETTYFSYFDDKVYPKEGTSFNVSDRQYFYCIPYETHIAKNLVIQQTQGWSDARGEGTFNPYE
ncbi:MAG: RagB/SusD family nutrient uptake outer membrane protein [Tannerella sp.]|nr:RagB/SusD family nutrient uptake outer membrane protein [Tannerella sp.]